MDMQQENVVQQPKKWCLWGNRFSRGCKLAFALCANAFTALTVLFFSPLEVYLGNVLEFSFPFNNVWWIMLAAAAALAGVVSAVEMLLPERLFWPMNLTGFGVGLCCYVQAMFLNGQMNSLTGEGDVYSTATVVLNLFIWALILAAVYIFAGVMVKLNKHRTAVSSLIFVSAALVTMQTVAFVTQLLSTDPAAFRKGDYLTNAGQFEVSHEDNVVEFIVDTCDVRYFRWALERYPDMTDNLKGFTHYNNTTSTHSRTFPSVTYMLTGNMCYFDKPYTQYVSDAHSNSTFLPDLKELGCDIRLFTESPYVSAEAGELLSNSASLNQGSLSYISVPNLLRQMTKIALYRDAPYLVKRRFAYEGGVVNRLVSRLPSPALVANDEYFYQQLAGDQRLTVSEKYDKAYRFYHFFGSHPGAKLNAQAQRDEEADGIDAIRGDFYIIEEYIAQLQALGLYEDTTIIITADHGSSGGTKTLEVDAPYCPLLLVKPAGKGVDDPFTVSQAPVAHADLFATVMAGVGGDTSAYGRPVWEIGEEEQRDRYYYYTALFSDTDGEIALREYLVRGDANDFANWSLTGRYWDVDYSQRAVSKHRLSDFQ